VLEHTLVHALIESGHPETLRARLRADENPRVIRAALVALDQREGGGLQAADVLGWLDSRVPRLKQTAGWIVERHPEWGDALAQHFRRQLEAAAARRAPELAALQAQLVPLAKSSAIQHLLAVAAREPGFPTAARLLALRAMAASGLKELPDVWQTTLVALLGGDDAALSREAVGTVRLLPLPRAGQAPIFGALARVGRDTAHPAAVRLDALAVAHPAALGPIEPALFDFLRTHLDGREPMLVRGAAATVLAKAALAPAQQLTLAEALRSIGALEAPKLLPAFEKNPHEVLGLKLVAALARSPGLAGIRPNVLQALLARYPASVQQQGAALLAGLNTDAARQNARVDELLAGVKHGDIRRGQALFNSERTACKLCHTIGYHGGKLGPDLSGIGKIRNERELLEATIFPSATFVRGFEPFVATTKGGESHGGILRKDAPDEIILATGPDLETRLARADLADLQPGSVSPMPPGMDAILSREELADLVTFLKSLQR